MFSDLGDFADLSQFGVLVLVFRTVIVMVWSVIGVTVFSDLGDFADQSFWPNVIFNNRVNNKFRSINPQ